MNREPWRATVLGVTKTQTELSEFHFDCVDHNKLWKIRKEMEIPDHVMGFPGGASAKEPAS